MIVTSVRMPMIMMPGREHSDEVDCQPDRADDEELVRIHLRGIEQALDRLEDDEDRDEAEEQAIRKARKRLDSRVPGGKRQQNPRKPGGARLTRR